MAGDGRNGNIEAWWAVIISDPVQGLRIVQWLEKGAEGRYYQEEQLEGIDTYLTGKPVLRAFTADGKGVASWAGPTQEEIQDAVNRDLVRASEEDHETIKPDHIVIFFKWETEVETYQYAVGTVSAATKDVITMNPAMPKSNKAGWERLTRGWYRDKSKSARVEYVDVPVHRVLLTPCRMKSGDNEKNFQLTEEDITAAIEAATVANQIPDNLKKTPMSNTQNTDIGWVCACGGV